MKTNFFFCSILQSLKYLGSYFIMLNLVPIRKGIERIMAVCVSYHYTSDITEYFRKIFITLDTFFCEFL